MKTVISRMIALSLIIFPLSISLWPSMAIGEEKTTIKLGVMDGEESMPWQTAIKEAAKLGLTIELVRFSDYTIPNEALNAGEIDANSFQHKPYFDAQVAQRGYKLSVAGYSLMFPISVYSRKIDNLSALKEGAIVGIPNDPSNGGRALRLMDHLGLIKLRNSDDVLATKFDIIENPKHLDIRELDAGVIGRAINDFDIAIVNTGWAITTGLDLEKDRLAREEVAGNPYNNVIAVRTQDLDKPWVKTLVQSYQNAAVKQAIKDIFGTAAQTSW